MRGLVFGSVSALRIGPTPANQYSTSVNTSQIAPSTGSQRDHGAFATRSGRVRREIRALMPGMIQLSDDARIVNHADATRFSFPSRAGSALGARNPRPIALRIAKLENSRKTTAIASVARIALPGARSRSEIVPNQAGTCRSRLQASAIRLMKIT